MVLLLLLQVNDVPSPKQISALGNKHKKKSVAHKEHYNFLPRGYYIAFQQYIIPVGLAADSYMAKRGTQQHGNNIKDVWMSWVAYKGST